MSNKDKIHEFADKFWKYASDTKGVLSLDDVYLDWSNDSDMTIKEFGLVWAKINNDIVNKFGLKKADISFSRSDDIMDLVQLLKNTDLENNDIESMINDTSSMDKPEKSNFDLGADLETNSETDMGISKELDTDLSTDEPQDLKPDEESGEPDLKLTESLLL